MYPETDLPLLKISRDFINEAKKDLPKLRTEVAGELKEKGLSEEMIKLALSANKVEELKSLVDIYPDINFIGKMILLFPKEIASKEKKSLEEIEGKLAEHYPDVLRAINKKKILEGDVKRILIKIIHGESLEKVMQVEKTDSSEIEGEILKIIKGKPGLNANAYMGLIMAKFKGKINGKEAMEIINKVMKR